MPAPLGPNPVGWGLAEVPASGHWWPAGSSLEGAGGTGLSLSVALDTSRKEVLRLEGELHSKSSPGLFLALLALGFFPASALMSFHTSLHPAHVSIGRSQPGAALGLLNRCQAFRTQHQAAAPGNAP